MHIRRTLAKLNDYDHELHLGTLILVIISVTAGWLENLLPESFSAANGALASALHWIHYLSIGLVVVYAAVKLIFSRKPGKEIAALLPRPRMAEQTAHQAPLKAYSYRGRPVPAEDREFVTQEDSAFAAILYEMNRSAYEGSAFELSMSEAQKRDAEIIRKSKVSFMLFRDPNRELEKSTDDDTIDDFVGYTAVLPLNPIGRDVYLRGLIPDRSLPASLICGDGEQAAIIVLFAMHLRKPYRAKNAGQKYSFLLARCIEEHIKAAARAHARPGDLIEVWVQSEDQSMRDHYIYRGFQPAGLMSNEGFPFYFRQIEVE